MTTPAQAARTEIEHQFEAVGDDAGRIPTHILEACANLVADMRDTQARVEQEGLIVSDAKGAPDPHPALDVILRVSRELREHQATLTPKAPRRR
ncbi:P27 family phage terminase small subunit [Actinomyces bowdenii]|uniref:P27 family phage terminase small subunit n=1 Tax=Actinomyces bowdenii TaxID=131109 RepID=UPI00214C3F92|nr:P27 family phage terminase small subunit [Actinomyces bowdenii]MCR2051805.1 P27 family phage terminase small subunit [Actinomyces bowdenii]